MSRLELSLAIIFPATAGLLQDIMGTAMTKTIKVTSAAAAASGKLLSHPPISSWMVMGGQRVEESSGSALARHHGYTGVLIYLFADDRGNTRR